MKFTFSYFRSLRILDIRFLPILALWGVVTCGGAGTLQAAEVIVDPSQVHQKMDGFGATHYPLIYTPGDNRLSPSLQAQALDAVYGQVQLTTGNVTLPLYETPATATDLWNSRRNDNADPLAINAGGFNFRLHDEIKTRFLDPARERGFDDFYLGLTISVRWSSSWMKTIRSSNYNRYLDECAEQIAAGALHWRDKNGISPRFIQLFNEPTSGNRELDGGSPQEVRDIVKRVGERLRSLGFADAKFVVPGEEAEYRSLEVAKVILADPDARQFVGAIAYLTRTAPPMRTCATPSTRPAVGIPSRL